MRILILGAGRIGTAVAHMMADAGDHRITLADRHFGHEAGQLAPSIAQITADAGDPADLDRIMRDHDAVLAAGPYHLCPVIAEAAVRNSLHYFDLTEDVRSTRAVSVLAEGARTALVPQCGLAPGVVCVMAHGLAHGFDQVEAIRIRVGALPAHPTGPLGYAMTWSTAGVVNEYCNPCEAIWNGERREVLPLEGEETVILHGTTYEAFNTSGGLGMLADAFDGRIRTLDYKTLRYPGHRAIMKLLLEDLKLRDRRDLLEQVLEASVPTTDQDVVVLSVSVDGMVHGRLTRKSWTREVGARDVAGMHMSAIRLTTAAGVAAVIDMLAAGQLPQQGLVRHDHIDADTLLANRFGQHYA
ncbi:saccharopine dehydrogenase C-terminal domain-containing protein [Tistrella bauzanensis]|uniref:saccharopine dehydrogenase family protein n=1 Tax=Tistrella TaxID=171436 RepID=UPI0031F5FA82